MISRFFINRPIFASVLSIVITLAGAISVFTLPLSQFPNVTPPTVWVQANYPGASAQDVADAVAAPIEQQVNGVEGMMYMSSQCANDGSYNLTVTFRQGIDLNMAQVLVQNRVSLATPLLPDVIKQTGVITRKRSPDILMGMALNSPNGRYDQLYLSNFALMQIKDELARVPGVGDVFLFGQRDYSMRIWVNPSKLAARNLTAGDVVRAIREQNTQVATGYVGQEPAHHDQEFQITLSTQGRLTEPEQFGNMVLKTGPNGRITRLKDVARVELGSKNDDISIRFDGKETVFLAIFQMPDANALDVRQRVIAKMEELKEGFPEGVDYDIGFDTTPYTSESIREVVRTLRIAILLVAGVVLLFLQNWRSAIIPLIAVPVAIIGTFAAMAVLGFSLNNLTLFGLVLSIGIVVDDAIVVVEAVEHHIELGLSPREATFKAMEQVSGPVIAVGLVLSAVFVPCAFISGITGQFFRQFAVTIAVSTVISTFNSLTLSPALTALLLRPQEESRRKLPLPRFAFVILGGWLGWELLAPQLTAALPAGAETSQPVSLLVSWSPYLVALFGAAAGWVLGRWLNPLLAWLFRGFNRGFRYATRRYTGAVGVLLRVSAVVLVVYGGLLALTYWRFTETPKGFIPNQDMGYLLITLQLPDSASKERTDQVMRQIEALARPIAGVRHVSGISGMSFVLNAAGSNFGSTFVNLKDFPDRRGLGLSSDDIANNLRKAFADNIRDADVAVFGPPPVRGFRSGGFALMLEDRGSFGPHVLQKQTEDLISAGRKQPALTGLFSVFRANVPQLHIEPDKRACMMKGVNLRDFSDTLAVYEGSLYVNDFNLFDRTWQVIVQAESEFRDQPEDLYRLKVRNARGGMVPLGSVAQMQEVNGPLVLTRYNMYPASSINGTAAPGISSGEVRDLMQRLAKEQLPPGQGMLYEWTDMSYLELIAGNTAMMIFAFGVVAVFLVLAALYESWALPLAVILVVPVCLLSAIAGVNVARMDINIFTQIGFVVLVGLASKNSILIVEFAKKQREAGATRHEAALAACQLRLRPIVMTSLAFVLGVMPMMVAHGAGAEMRQTLGTAVFYGMLGVTLFGIFLTPVFFFTVNWASESRLFGARSIQVAGRFSLDLITLGLRRIVSMVVRRKREVVASSATRSPSLQLSPPSGDGENGGQRALLSPAQRTQQASSTVAPAGESMPPDGDGEPTVISVSRKDGESGAESFATVARPESSKGVGQSTPRGLRACHPSR
jgi:multidrug efflux pump